MSTPVPPQQTVVIQRPASNGMGVAGFVCSLLGLLSCGLLSPFGLLFSFIGMFKAPRGLAVAGFVMGVIGSAWIFVAVFFVGIAAIAAALGLEDAAATVKHVSDAAQIHQAIIEYERANGSPPADLDALGLDDALRLDGWGQPYHIEYADGMVTIISNGPDMMPGTDDDRRVDYMQSE